MLQRPISYPLSVLLLLLLVIAGLVYGSWFSITEAAASSWPQWLSMVGYALMLQVVLGYLVWWFVHQRQRPAQQTEVFHSIVHEFQTPITAIRMATDILDSPIARDHPERTEKYVRIIREETERLQHQVETVLTLARADRNTLILNTEPIQIHRLIHSIAERHGAYLTLNLANTEPYVQADRFHLTNVFYNLLDNAVKYSTNEPEITIQTKQSRDGLLISVKDRGVGISPKAVAQIFQPFFRVSDRDQPSVKGFGLGLNYVQRIVQAHHWSIWVKSEVGAGSEFMIQIPPSALLSAAASDSQSKPLFS